MESDFNELQHMMGIAELRSKGMVVSRVMRKMNFGIW